MGANALNTVIREALPQNMLRGCPALRNLADHSAGRENNFNLLRLIAATMVLVSHSYALSTGNPDLEPLRWLSGFSLGALAVDVFFIASGYLVAGSLLNRRNLLEFCLARGLRIFPGLWVVLLLTILIVGAGFTTRDARSFFTDWQTWHYFVKNATLVGGVSFNLPEAFTDVPYATAVNSSLWTLPTELYMYGWLAAAWAAFRVARLNPETSLRVFCCGIAVIAIAIDVRGFVLHRPWPFVGLLAKFFTGAALCVLRQHIPASKLLFSAFLGAILLSTLHPMAFGLIYRLGIGYVVIYAALVPSGFIRTLSPRSDYSYGIYIYAFPVQQAIASLWQGVTPMEMMACAFPVTLIFAAASWHLVEKRALRYKEMFDPHRKAMGRPLRA